MSEIAKTLKHASLTRLALAGIGLAGMAWGVRLIFDDTRISRPWKLLEWLIGAVIIHDGILVPVTLTIGAVLTATIPPRARRYIQGGLIASALVTAVAIALIYRQGDQEGPLALLQQNYRAHLALVIAIIVAITGAAYLVRVLRERQAANRQQAKAANVRPSAVQTSDSE